MSGFKKAVKAKSKLRLAIFGPSGGGKTMTALRIAVGMLAELNESGGDTGNGRIALIDTEYGSASLYGDRYDFDACELDDKTIDGYVEAMRQAAREHYPILVVDSGSHAWQELLEEVDHLAKTKYRGNSFQAWSEGTPKQRSLVKAILAFPGHIIWTMRSKTEWLVDKDERTGKSKPVRVGLTPEQGKGIEYEFTMLMDITPEHIATFIKDRTSRFQDKMIEKPGEDLGAELIQWLNTGVEPAPVHDEPADEPKQKPRTTAAAKGNGNARKTSPPKSDPEPPQDAPREAAQEPAEDESDKSASDKQIAALCAISKRNSVTSEELLKRIISEHIGRGITSFRDLTFSEASNLIGDFNQTDVFESAKQAVMG